MVEPRWIDIRAVYEAHDVQLAVNGGLEGVRDSDVLEAALSRPLNLIAYGDPDIADLAASYMAGLARAHGFADGNKRTAWAIGRLFLLENDYRLVVSLSDATKWLLGVVNRDIDEAQLADMIRRALAPTTE